MKNFHFFFFFLSFYGKLLHTITSYRQMIYINIYSYIVISASQFFFKLLVSSESETDSNSILSPKTNATSSREYPLVSGKKK